MLPEDSRSPFVELKAVAGFLAEIASFHLQVADQQPSQSQLPVLPADIDRLHLHKAQARFYEILKQQLALLAQHLDTVQIGDLQDDVLDNLEKIWTKIDRLISTPAIIEIWGRAGFTTSDLESYRFSNLGRLKECLVHNLRDQFLKDDKNLIFLPKYKKGPSLATNLQKFIDQMEGKSLIDPETELNYEDWSPKFFDGKLLRGLHRVRDLACKLHASLHNHWPCKCGNSHLKTIGDCQEAKLRLGPNWSSGKEFKGVFNLLLCGHYGKQECQICVIEQKPSDPIEVCQLIAAEEMSRCLNLALDHEGKIWDQEPCLDRTLAVDPTRLIEMNLQEMLEALPYVGLKKKRVLAVILATSLLHIYHTLWLKPTWSMDNISFFCYYEGNDLRFDPSQPYLSTKFGDTGEAPPAGRRRRMLHKYPSLLSLARVLLEIELSDRIKYIREQEKFQDYLRSVDPNTNKLIVEFLLAEYRKHRYSNSLYVKAIEKCFEPHFLLGFENSANPYVEKDIMKAIYVNIVGPLEQELLEGFSQEGQRLGWEHLDGLLSKEHMDQICGWKKPAQKPVTTFITSKPLKVNNPRQIVHPSEALEVIQEESSETHRDLSIEDESGTMADVFDSDTAKASEDGVEWTDTWFKELSKVQSLVDRYWIKPLSIEDKAKRIKIAILDTGIDLTHPLFQKHLSDGQFPDSWDFVENRQNVIDICGHGTHTAHVLLKTAPNVSVYVARVFRTTKAEKNTASLVAQAIEYAVKTWGVDIISMSFSFSSEVSSIRKAVKMASMGEKEVLMFAAASNNRHNKRNPIGYPAKLKEHVICVNSTNGRYRRSEFSPKAKSYRMNFSVVGERVEAAWPVPPGSDEVTQKRQNGTSCATPIATGIAALVLEYAAQSQSQPKPDIRIQKVEALRRCAGMRKVIYKCMTKDNKPASYKNIKPWLLFDPYAQRTTISHKISEALEDPDDLE